MAEKYVSEWLANHCPASFINFLWYLWELYCDPGADECRLLLEPGENGQRVTVLLAGKMVEQEFGTAMNATIVIHKDNTRFYMSRQ